MNSTLSCIGINYGTVEEVISLLDRIEPYASLAGRIGADLVQVWQDPSGARLIFASRDGDRLDLLPSFAGGTSCQLAECTMWNPSVAYALLQDGTGQQLTALTFAPEQHRWLQHAKLMPRAAANLVVLGIDLQLFADARDFENSAASLLQADSTPEGLRLAGGSLLSYGPWGEQAEADAFCRLAAVVASAECRRNLATGDPFTLVRGLLLGCEVELCLPASVPVPQPGQVLAGLGYLVGRLAGVPYGHPAALATSSAPVTDTC
ncbi:MAG TPA: hypothetical protein VHO01_12710 [Jatrophihabitans sp.]|nr:hypothetical protein [Jatrophihabitans sp.]